MFKAEELIAARKNVFLSVQSKSNTLVIYFN